MNHREKLRRVRVIAILPMAAMLALAGSMRIGAQSFEKTFGRENRETGRAIVQTADGGYITAGYTADAGSRELAYVARMRPDGSSAWERRFSVGNAAQTSGMDLKQLANGDHLLVGTVMSGTVGCLTGCAHIYAIRFSDNGDLIWYRSYGDNATSQYATSVVETRVPNPNIDDIGNLIVAGYTIDQVGEHQGVLMRLWGNGDLRWGRIYDAAPSATNINELMGVDEARIGPGAGDIVATGFTVASASKEDVWVLRVDGATGMMLAAPHGSATFSTRSDDRGYSIQEMRLGANPADLVIAGESFGRAGSSNSEVLMLETLPDPCDPAGQRGDQFLGDGGGDPNVARSVREISDPTLGGVGDLIVTGTSHVPGYDNDLFLQQFAQGTMAPVGAHHVYGGRKQDSGYAVAEVSGIAGPAGFIAVGVTTSSPPAPMGHAADLYVVHTDVVMSSCTERSLEVTSEEARLRRRCVGAQITDPRWNVLCSGDSYGPNWGAILCQ